MTSSSLVISRSRYGAVKGAVAVLMAFALVLGLMPLPAYADLNQVALFPMSLPGGGDTTDPSDIGTSNPYDDGESIEWRYTYSGEDADSIDGLKVTLADDCVTEKGFDFLKICDPQKEVLFASLTGDFSNRVVFAPGVNALKFMFSSNEAGTERGFRVKSIEPLNELESALSKLDDEAKAMVLDEDNITIDGIPAAEYSTAFYPQAAEGEGQRVPTVSIAYGEHQLREGFDFEVRYYHRGRLVEGVSGPGTYRLLIAGKNLLSGVYSSTSPEGSDEPVEATYAFDVYGDADEFPQFVRDLELLSYETVDERYPDASAKAAAVEAFVDDCDGMRAGIEYLEHLGKSAESELGSDAYGKAVSAMQVAEGFIDLSLIEVTPFFKTSDGDLAKDTVSYANSGVSDALVLKAYDGAAGEGNGDYVALAPGSYAFSYLDSNGVILETEYPVEVGRYSVLTWGLGRYYGSLKYEGCVYVSDVTLYAGIENVDGSQTLWFSKNPLELGEGAIYWSDAYEFQWNSHSNRFVPKWFYDAVDVTAVRFEEGTYIPSLSNMFVNMSDLRTVDFTGLVTDRSRDEGAFKDCLLERITFGSYVPSEKSGISGKFANPGYEEGVPGSVQYWSIEELFESMTDELRVTWRYGSYEVWSLDDGSTSPVPPDDDRIMIDIPSSDSLEYNGEEQVLYSDNEYYSVKGGSATTAGVYYATFTLKDTEHYKWDDGWDAPKRVEWEIEKAWIAEPDPKILEFAYDGTEKTVLADNAYYQVKNGSAIDPGVYTAIVSLKDADNYWWNNDGDSPITITWKIIASGVVNIPEAVTGLVYNGVEQVGVEESSLYNVEGGAAVNAGSYTATLTLRDTGRFTWPDGSTDPREIEWSIAKKPVSVRVHRRFLTYNGKTQNAITSTEFYKVKNGSARDAGSYTATLSLNDPLNYIWRDGESSDKKIRWSISKLSINRSVVSLKTRFYNYDGKLKTPAVKSVVLRTGAALSASDYTVTYSNNKNAGTATVKVSGKGNYSGSASAEFTIAPKPVVPNVTLSAKSYVYNGKSKTPTVKVKVGKSVLGKANYSVTLPKGRKTVGAYDVTVTLKGNYRGSAKASYVIVPKGTSLSKLKTEPKSLTVKWNKQATQVSGYQLAIATNARFTRNSKRITVAGAANVSREIKGLRGRTRYYAKIRTYKTVGKHIYYSNWSAVASAATV